MNFMPLVESLAPCTCSWQYATLQTRASNDVLRARRSRHAGRNRRSPSRSEVMDLEAKRDRCRQLKTPQLTIDWLIDWLDLNTARRGPIYLSTVSPVNFHC